MTIASILLITAQISIFLTVLSLGMRASVADILYLVRHAGLLLRALVAVFVIMPIVAIVMVKLIGLDPTVAVVLLALSVSPVPPLFPKKALKTGGEASFTFGLLSVIAILSLVMIPIWLAVFEIVFTREAKLSQIAIAIILTKTLLAPMAIGMTIRHFAPAFSEHYASLVEKVGAILLIVTSLPLVVGLLPEVWVLIGNFTLIAFAVFAMIGAATGYFLGGPSVRDRGILALATASRHPAIAITIAGANVDGTLMKTVAAAVILYLILSAIVVTPFLKWLSSRRSEQETYSNAF